MKKEDYVIRITDRRSTWIKNIELKKSVNPGKVTQVYLNKKPIAYRVRRYTDPKIYHLVEFGEYATFGDQIKIEYEL